MVLTYIDQSDEINDSDNNLEYFVDSSSFDYQIVPNVSNGKVSFNFYTNNGTFLSKTPEIEDAEFVKLRMVEGDVSTQYKLGYSIDDITFKTIDTFTSADSSNLECILSVQELPSKGMRYNIIIENSTKVSLNKGIQLREYDDEGNNFSFSTDKSSTGQVTLILKLDSDPLVDVDNSLNYYWVNIQVIDSTDEVMAELYSSIRRE